MNKCFITKLQGVVDNASLLKLGELRIGFSNNGNPSNIQSIGVGVTNPVSLEILGDGYFTDSKNSNLGKKMDFNYPSNAVNMVGSNTLSIVEKYNLTTLSISSRQTNVTDFCIDDLKASKELVKLNMNSEFVTGDIASLGNLIGLTTIDITGTSLSGNISIFSKFPKLASIYMTNSNVTGNIDVLYNNSVLTEIFASNTNITGDLAKLPELCTFISISNKNDNSFTWSTRSASSKIVAISGYPKITNIDKMLQDQAQCVTGITDSPDEFRKAISVTGTRTSASDAAVQTLQAKGYTVTITPA